MIDLIDPAPVDVVVNDVDLAVCLMSECLIISVSPVVLISAGIALSAVLSAVHDLSIYPEKKLNAMSTEAEAVLTICRVTDRAP